MHPIREDLVHGMKGFNFFAHKLHQLIFKFLYSSRSDDKNDKRSRSRSRSGSGERNHSTERNNESMED